MTNIEVRKIVVESLEYAGVLGVCNNPVLKAKLLEEENEITMQELDLDSLSKMELCIALEVNHAIEIVPEELDQFTTFNSLIQFIINSKSDA